MPFRGSFSDILYMVGFTAFLAILVACLGLLGMSVYSVEIRQKEFGIRKVMGAHGGTLFINAGRPFLILIFIATLIALPLSYFGNRLWLQSLPYTVSFGFWDLLIGTLATILIAILTIGPQTLKASRAEPARLLRYE